MMRKSTIAQIPEEPLHEERQKGRKDVDIRKLKKLVGTKRSVPKLTDREQVKFTLRIEAYMLEQVRAEASKRSGNISANQWITEVIEETLRRAK